MFANFSRASDRNPLFHLRQGNIAYTLLLAGNFFGKSFRQVFNVIFSGYLIYPIYWYVVKTM
jgi:hypothetical protein